MASEDIEVFMYALATEIGDIVVGTCIYEL
jgi:hypothetical protein